MASIVEEYEREFKPFYDVAEAGKTAVWEFSQMFGEEDSDSESGDESDDGTEKRRSNASEGSPRCLPSDCGALFLAASPIITCNT